MEAQSGLVVDSVTGVDVALPVAGPGARSFAFLIDWAIRAILSVAWYVVAAVQYNHGWNIAAPLSPGAAWFVYVVAPPAAIYFLYHPIWEVLTRGQTPGKRMAGVQIVSRDGGTPGVGALLARNVFRLIDSLPVAYAVGLVTTMITRNYVRIGDLAAGTVLAYVHRLDVTDKERASPLSSSDQALRTALLRRTEIWKAATARTRRLASKKTDDAADAAELADDYRMLAHDVAKARRLLPDSRAREYLESAYAQSHSTLYKPALHPASALLALFRDEIPAVVSWLRPHIIWATALFILTIATGYAMVRTYPDLIALFASPELIASVERGQLWTEGLLNVVPSSVLSLQILTNNIVVSLFAYCAGFLFGLGTLYILGLNGLMLGAVFAFTGQHALDDDLFRFVVAHGCVEISVMCLSGAAGAAVGEALIRPGAATRAASFQHAALQSGKLILACVLLLIGSGLIEGYISPNPAFSLTTRIAVGVGYWLCMIALLNGWLFGRVPGFLRFGASGAATHTRPAPSSPEAPHLRQ
jgi:uncharacterized membrane protein SpoIIM required for sporulation/uncharacterized RDD family membrane protein YckC